MNIFCLRGNLVSLYKISCINSEREEGLSYLGWAGASEHTENLNSSIKALRGWQDLWGEEDVSLCVFEGWALSTMALGSRSKDPQESSLWSVEWTLGRDNLVVFLSQIPFFCSGCHIKKKLWVLYRPKEGMGEFQ